MTRTNDLQTKMTLKASPLVKKVLMGQPLVSYVAGGPIWVPFIACIDMLLSLALNKLLSDHYDLSYYYV
jgi:hypothetical protein